MQHADDYMLTSVKAIKLKTDFQEITQRRWDASECEGTKESRGEGRGVVALSSQVQWAAKLSTAPTWTPWESLAIEW